MGRILFIIVCLLWGVSISQAQVTPGTVNSKTLDGVGNKITSQAVGLDRPLHVYCLGGTCGGAGGTSDVNIIQILGVAPGAANPLPGRLSTGVAYYDARDRNWTLSSGTDSVASVQSGVWNIGTLTSITNPVAVTGTFFQATQPVSGTVAVSNAFLLDATFTGRFAAAFLDADAIANQTTTAVHGFGYMYNGATWDRMRGTIAGGLLVDVSDLFLLDATLTNRFPAGSTPADNESNAVTISRIGNFNYIFDGVAWDRWTGAVSQSGTWNIGTLTSITNPVTVNSSTVASANNDGACLSGAANFTVAASNASRLWVAVWASPANTDDVFIKLGATATSSDARFAPGQSLNITSGRIYTGIIDAFPASGTQAVCLMELN